jgi:hypothetical protein
VVCVSVIIIRKRFLLQCYFLVQLEMRQHYHYRCGDEAARSIGDSRVNKWGCDGTGLEQVRMVADL